jgi:PAS domain S-box-containing protein
MPNSEGKKRPLGRVEAMQKRKRKREYTRINAAGVKTMEGRDSTQEEKYRMLVQNLPCAVYSAYPGKVGPTTFMSDKWKDWTGYSPEELYQNPEAWPKCIHPDDREKAANAYSRACQNNVPYNLEYRIVHKGTEQVRYVKDQGILSNNKKDDIIRVDGIITDVSELKRAERALQESEERFKNIFNNALVGLYRTTPDGRILMANPALVRMLGYDSFEELARRNLEEDGFEPQYFRSNFKERVEVNDRVIGLEADWVRRDGTILSIRESAKAIRDEHGNILYYEGTVEDISERKRAEDELRRHRDHLEEMVKKRTAELTGAYETLKVENKERKRAEQALREVEREKTTVLENLSDLIVYRDRDMVTLWASKSMANWHGMSQDQIVGRICYKARYGRDEPCEECHVIEAIKSGQRQELEKQIPDERCWHVIVNPILDDSGQVIGTIEVSQDITERKRADQALRETTNLLETILEHTHMLVACLDPQFNFVQVNRAYAEADERQPSFFHGKNHFDLYPNEENEVIFRRVIETGIPYFTYAKPFEYAEHPERGISYWDWSLVPIKNQQGIVSGLVLTLADVTARKRAEESLKASEGKLNAMLQSISDHMSMMDKDLNILWANDEAKRRFGDDIVGKKCYEVYHGRQSPCEPHSCLTLRAFQDGGVHEHDTEDTDENGNTAWFHCVANVALRNEEGEATAVLEISTDITERKQAEDTLRQYEFMVESAHDAIFFKDRQSRYIIANEKTLESFGLSREQVIGKSDFEIMPEREQAKQNIDDDQAVFEIGKPKEIIKEMTGADGEKRWFQAIKVPQFDKNGDVIGLIGIARDITKHKRAELTGLLPKDSAKVRRVSLAWVYMIICPLISPNTE